MTLDFYSKKREYEGEKREGEGKSMSVGIDSTVCDFFLTYNTIAWYMCIMWCTSEVINNTVE